MGERVGMNISYDFPPNFERIAERFPQARKRGAIFCYGGTIHNPSRVALSAALMAHEAVHSKQQGGNPEGWWERYCTDPQFVLEQELEAHQEEYRVETSGANRNQRRFALKGIAGRLSSALYGKLISFDEAKRLVAA